ncbi:hypothetical protein [Psychroflexus torquis]|uniref:hypothetical protein n=1 Tax=Psychroflexus torquis TaxID=57029 RepID=UPI001FE2387C|nr:hypothetical protein [Psychroflexus torquis]
MSRTKAISQNQILMCIHTALSGQLLVYLNPRNGAKTRVSAEIISERKKAINNPLIVNRRIKDDFQKRSVYEAAHMKVMSKRFQLNSFS